MLVIYYLLKLVNQFLVNNSVICNRSLYLLMLAELLAFIVPTSMQIPSVSVPYIHF